MCWGGGGGALFQHHQAGIYMVLSFSSRYMSDPISPLKYNRTVQHANQYLPLLSISKQGQEMFSINRWFIILQGYKSDITKPTHATEIFINCKIEDFIIYVLGQKIKKIDISLIPCTTQFYYIKRGIHYVNMFS